MIPAPKRRWFRFSLRTLFVVVTVLSVWLAYQLNWVRQRRSALDSGKVFHASTGIAPEHAHWPPWPLYLFDGRLISGSLLMDRAATEDQLRHMRALFPEVDVQREYVIDCLPPLLDQEP